MKKRNEDTGKSFVKIMIIALALLTAFLTSCSTANEIPKTEAADQSTESAEGTEENTEMRSITMKINDEEVQVTWEDNGSVKALAELAADAPLVIDTSMYGGFEQVGSLGTTLPSSDVNITTNPGDIVLYTGSNIVVFYGNNSWDYTKLGHIENKSTDELADLLGNNNVTITFTAE